MKYLLVAVSAAAIGATVGALASGIRGTARGRVETKELVILDESGRSTARLGRLNGQTLLQFYEDSHPVLEVGVDNANPSRFVRFLDKKGEIIASLNTVSSGDPTLYLADRRWGTRVIMGALQSDVITDQPTSEWGLVFRKPGSSQAMFNILVRAPDDPAKATVAVGILRSAGENIRELSSK